MDYSKLSDFEINKRVLAIKSGIKPLGYAHNADARSAGIVDVSKNYHWFDFCNNPADAWPIILATKIQTYWRGETWGARTIHTPVVECQNPLRAAMIVFLMMQESE